MAARGLSSRLRDRKAAASRAYSPLVQSLLRPINFQFEPFKQIRDVNVHRSNGGEHWVNGRSVDISGNCRCRHTAVYLSGLRDSGLNGIKPL